MALNPIEELKMWRTLDTHRDEAIHEARKQGYTIEEISQATGMSIAMLYRIEQNRRNK